MAESWAIAQTGQGLIEPQEACNASLAGACETAPPDGKEHVYTFIVNGCDPFQLGNLKGVADYMRGLGFSQTHFDSYWNCRDVGRQIRAIRQSDPDAKIVLMGYSWASLMVRRLANDLDKEGIALDVLVYLGGDYISNTQRSRPTNVGQVVNIRGHGLMLSGYDLFFNGVNIDNAVNMRLDAGHFALPSQAQTVETLASRLTNLAQESHVAIAARQLKELPTADLAQNRSTEKSPLVVHPTSITRPGSAEVSKP
jgi:hypothetical protein